MAADDLKNVAQSPLAVADPVWAWTRYEPDAERPWNLRLAGHLYRRAAFGGDWDRLRRAVEEGPQRTIDRLVRPEADVAQFNRSYDEFESTAIDPDSDSTEVLREWWLRRMIDTPHPLLEKMTLFWHNHFAASDLRVYAGRLVQRHVQKLRSHALGRLPPLLQEVCLDPAVFVSLGGAANRKARPNNAFARRLLEHFLVGPGCCCDRDVQETARALTGWFVVRAELRFHPFEHDDGVKHVFGREGKWKGEDAVRIASEQPAAARWVVEKVYRWLISETDPPGDRPLAPLAESFAKDQDIAKLVETMLRSNWFFSPAAYRCRVKSPVEFALGIIKPLEELATTRQLGADLAELGQNLCSPPTIDGWEGGRAWINRFTLLGRSNLAAAMLAGGNLYGDKLDPQAVVRKHAGASSEKVAQFLLDLFLQGDAPSGTREQLVAAAEKNDPSEDSSRLVRRLTHTVVTLPEFQLS